MLWIPIDALTAHSRTVIVPQVIVCSRRHLVSKVSYLGRCLVDLAGLESSLTRTDWYLLRESSQVQSQPARARDTHTHTASTVYLYYN